MLTRTNHEVYKINNNEKFIREIVFEPKSPQTRITKCWRGWWIVCCHFVHYLATKCSASASTSACQLFFVFVQLKERLSSAQEWHLKILWSLELLLQFMDIFIFLSIFCLVSYFVTLRWSSLKQNVAVKIIIFLTFEEALKFSQMSFQDILISLELVMFNFIHTKKFGVYRHFS